jgi:hypothetical protein
MGSLRLTPDVLAEALHYFYESFKPQFGFEASPGYSPFDPHSANGRLMLAVCVKVLERWHLVAERPKQEMFQFMGTNERLAEFDREGQLVVFRDVEELEHISQHTWENNTRALASLILVIARERLALNAADALAHAFLFSPEHEVYWRERNKVGRCSACNDPEHTR